MKDQTILDDDFRVHSKDEQAEIKGLKFEIKGLLEKDIKNGKTTFIVLAVFSLFGVALTLYNDMSAAEVVIEYILLTAFYLVLAIYTTEHPKFVFITGLILYSILQIFALIIDPTNIASGILFKGIIIYYLFKALQAGLEVAKKRKRLKALGVEV